MKTKKTNEIPFVFYPSFRDQLKAIKNDKVRLFIFDALIDYGICGIEPDFTDIDPLGVCEALFIPMKREIDTAKARYLASVENGKKGGNPNFKEGTPNPYYAPKDNQKITQDNLTLPPHNLNKNIDKDNINNPPIIPQTGDEDSEKTFSDNSQKEEKKSSAKRKELDLSIVDSAFREVVDEWLGYKSERGESYKPRGFTIFYKRLKEISGNNPAVARKIVERSMSCNYSGIFPLGSESVSNKHPATDFKQDGIIYEQF